MLLSLALPLSYKNIGDANNVGSFVLALSRDFPGIIFIPVCWNSYITQIVVMSFGAKWCLA